MMWLVVEHLVIVKFEALSAFNSSLSQVYIFAYIPYNPGEVANAAVR